MSPQANGRRPSCRRTPGNAQRVTGDWTLVGCTVAPGFEFAGFEMASCGFRAGGLLVNACETISFAAIRPPPAISTAASAMLALALAKPARIRNAVESSGVA